MPEQARAVAKELGLPYYETSVLTYFGVNQVEDEFLENSYPDQNQVLVLQISISAFRPIFESTFLESLQLLELY